MYVALKRASWVCAYARRRFDVLRTSPDIRVNVAMH